MAGFKLLVSTSEVSVGGNATLSVLQLKAPANQKLMVRSIRLFGKAAAGGTDSPLKVRTTRSTANFGTFTAVTPAKNDPLDTETPQGTYGKNASVEPTTPSDGGYWAELQPQSGFIDYLPPDSPMEIPGGQSLQVEVTTPNATAQTVVCVAMVEE